MPRGRATAARPDLRRQCRRGRGPHEPRLELAPETRSRDRLWFGFRPDKPGKRPGFTDSTGEYRDTRTGWLGELDSNCRDAVDLMNLGESGLRCSAGRARLALQPQKMSR